MEKKLVRKEILNMRNNMSNEKRILKDKLIYNLFINSDLYKKAKDIFIYVNHNKNKNTKKGKTLKIASIKYTPSFINFIILDFF